MYVSSAPGKLILLGEYSVLYGGVCLVKAVNRFASVKIKPSQEYSFSSPAFGVKKQKFDVDGAGGINIEGEAENGEAVEFFRRIASPLFWQAANEGKDFPAHYELVTSQFYENGVKYGIGSSAALAAALTGGIYSLYKLEGEKGFYDTVFRKAHKNHSLFQGKKGSGADIAASVYGGIIKYSVNDVAEPERLSPPGDLKTITVWTGKSASTKKYITKLKEYEKEHPDQFTFRMERMKTLAENGFKSFRNSDTVEFIVLADKFCAELLELGNDAGIPIVSEPHLKLRKKVSNLGGVYKPSGAGGGDIGVAFFKDEAPVEELQKFARHNNFRIPGFEVSEKGITFE